MIKTGESMMEYNKMIVQQMYAEEFDKNSSIPNYSQKMPRSIMSKHDRLSCSNREYKPKHSDRKSDYYRFNILYNRLASHANSGRAKTIT